MKKQFIKVVACALMAAILVAPTTALAADEKTESTPSAIYPFKKTKASIASHQKVNKEVIGWLTVPGTNINEPVTHSTKNNSYYVKRDWRGTNYPDIDYKNWMSRPATATYLDYRDRIGESWFKGTSRNLVLYGHNWNNLKESSLVVGDKQGYTMFAQLPSYTNKAFAEKNPYIYFSTGNEEGIWKVFAVAYCELNKKFPYNSPFSKKEEFAWLINEWKDRTIYDFSTEVNADDRILTLSTCTRQYDVGDNQRFVVVARLLRPGETENDKVKVSVNSDLKKPQFK